MAPRAFDRRLRDGGRMVPTGPVRLKRDGALTATTVYLPALSAADIGRAFYPLSPGSSAPVGNGALGPGLLSTNSNGGASALTGTNLGFISGPTTLFWAGDILGATGNGGGEIFGIEYANSGGSPYHVISLANDSSNNLYGYCTVGGSSYDVSSASGWAVGKAVTLCATFDPGGFITLYKNGVSLGTATVPSGSYTPSSTSELRLGNYWISNVPDGYSNALNNLCGVSSGIWTVAQVAQFAAAPFSMLERAGRIAVWDVGASAAISLYGRSVLSLRGVGGFGGTTGLAARSPMSLRSAADVGAAAALASLSRLSLRAQASPAGTTALAARGPASLRAQAPLGAGAALAARSNATLRAAAPVIATAALAARSPASLTSRATLAGTTSLAGFSAVQVKGGATTGQPFATTLGFVVNLSPDDPLVVFASDNPLVVVV